MKLKLKHITYIVGIISLIFILRGFANNVENSKIYDYESSKIIEEYGDEIFPVSSVTVTEEKLKKSSFLLLCGVEKFDELSLLSETSFTVSMDKNYGDIKLLAVNIENNDIITLEFNDGDNELLLSKGEYQLYTVGKWFCGNVSLGSV